MSGKAYHLPPDDYQSPCRSGCKTCGQDIFFAPVVGGGAWRHLRDDADHEVVMPYPWWDTDTGEWRTSPHVHASAA